MKVEINICLQHTAREAGIQERTFQRESTLRVELPFERDEFLGAIESLMTNNLQTVLASLCDRVQTASKAYLAEARKSGLVQLELPLNQVLNQEPGTQ